MTNDKRKQNALTHGLYASDLVLAWENPQDFLDLHQSVRDELNPEGISEDLVVLDLARLHWVKRRLNIGSQLAYHGHPDAAHLAEAGANGWSGVRKHLRSLVGDGDRLADHFRDAAKAQAKAATQLCDMIASRMAVRMASSGQAKAKSRVRVDPERDLAPKVLAQLPKGPWEPISDRGDEEKQAGENEELEGLIDLAKQVQMIGTNIVGPLKLVENYDLEQGVFERAYRPELLERQLKIEAQIDKQIEKALARLANLKVFKQIYAAKEVKGKRLAAITAPAPNKSRTK